MFLHLGNDVLIRTGDIIGIFDMDNTTVSRQGREFLKTAQNNNQIINTTEDLPKSYVVTKAKKQTKVYISSVSSKVLSKRIKTSKVEI